MIKKIKLFLLIPLMFVVSSCIEVTQDIIVHQDKSGSFVFKIDFGLLNPSNMGVFQGSSGMMSNIQKLPDKAVEKLTGMTGIKNVENLSDEKKGIYGFRFDFANDKAFNKAMYQLAEQQKLFFMPNYLKIKKKKVTITDIAPLIKKANSMSEKNQSGSFLNSQLNEYIFLTTRLTLPREIKNASNIRSKVDGHQVSLRASLSELINGVDFGNSVRY